MFEIKVRKGVKNTFLRDGLFLQGGGGINKLKKIKKKLRKNMTIYQYIHKVSIEVFSHFFQKNISYLYTYPNQ